MKDTKKKKKKWIKWRHRVIRDVAYTILYPYMRLKYNVKVERFKEQGKRPYLILMNHQTAFDQFFIGSAFRGAIYYVASEDLFSNGFVSNLLRYAVEPIPIKKQTTDPRAVLDCVRVKKEGGTIALAPEGNRTYSGKTEYIKPAIAGLIRILKLPVALFRIEGGYGVQPRWSDSVRKGKMRAYVSQVIEPEDVAKMSDEELMSAVEQGLYVNEGVVDGVYRHKKSAEYLDRAMYVCPYCGLSVFHSKNDIITCTKCERQIRYLPTKELEGVGFKFPYRFVTEWYEAQCKFVNNIDLLAYTDDKIYGDEAKLFEVILYKNKRLICKNAHINMYNNRFELCIEDKTFTIPFEQATAVTVLGRNKLNVYVEDRVLQFKGDKHFNALKYVNFYYRYKNITQGAEDGEFLGI